MLKLARWSTTHRKYVVLAWVVLLFGVNAIAQSAGHELLEQLHDPQLRRPARRRPARRELPGTGRRPRHDRLQGRRRQGHGPGRQGTDGGDVRRGREAAPRRRSDQPLLGRSRRAGDLGGRADRLRDGRVRRESQPAARRAPPKRSSPSPARPEARRSRSSSVARRSRRPSRPASASRPRSGCSPRSSSCC